jgi:hypothetical protein
MTIQMVSAPIEDALDEAIEESVGHCGRYSWSKGL